MATVAELEELNKTRNGINSVYNLILLVNYDEKTKSGTEIPGENITSVSLSEDIFGHLPKLEIKFSDTGITWFHKLNFEVGTRIYIRLYPNHDMEVMPAPYLEGVYIIQSYQNMGSPDTNTYIYTLECTYEANSYLNKICTWPPSDGTPAQIVLPETSNSIVPKIAGQGGLKCSAEIESSDSMIWVNNRLTCKDFINKILTHAWISEDDAPIFYIDRDGMSYYTSIRTLCNDSTKATYINYKTYDKEKKPDGTWDVYKRTYYDITVENRSYYSHENGNTGISNVYNPYLIFAGDLDYSTKIDGIPLSIIKQASQSYKYYQTNAGERAPFIPGISNLMTPANIRHKSSDTYFNNTHIFYDTAPIHNKNIISSFFQYFIHMSIDMNLQNTLDTQENQRLKLGDKVYIDFTTEESPESIQNGDFIVTNIIHTLNFMTSYTQLVTCVRDTVPGVKKRNN